MERKCQRMLCCILTWQLNSVVASAQCWFWSHAGYRSHGVMESSSTGSCRGQVPFIVWHSSGAGDDKVLEVPELWGICLGELHTGHGAHSREWRATSSKPERTEPRNTPFDTGHGMAGLSLQVTAICFLNSKSVDRLSNLKLDVFVTTWG